MFATKPHPHSHNTTNNGLFVYFKMKFYSIDNYHRLRHCPSIHWKCSNAIYKCMMCIECGKFGGTHNDAHTYPHTLHIFYICKTLMRVSSLWFYFENFTYDFFLNCSVFLFTFKFHRHFFKFLMPFLFLLWREKKAVVVNFSACIFGTCQRFSDWKENYNNKCVLYTWRTFTNLSLNLLLHHDLNEVQEIICA